MFSVALFISCTQVTAPAEVVSLNGEPDGPHTSIEWKVWAYSTAAPSYIAANCTVVDVDGTVLREGTNGWTAMAANPRGMSDPENGWKDPHEAMPMVGDGPAMLWAMAYMGGKTPQMDTDGWAWMLHGDMGEDNTKQLVFNKEDAAEGIKKQFEYNHFFDYPMSLSQSNMGFDESVINLIHKEIMSK